MASISLDPLSPGRPTIVVFSASRPAVVGPDGPSASDVGLDEPVAQPRVVFLIFRTATFIEMSLHNLRPAWRAVLEASLEVRSAVVFATVIVTRWSGRVSQIRSRVPGLVMRGQFVRI